MSNRNLVIAGMLAAETRGHDASAADRTATLEEIAQGATLWARTKATPFELDEYVQRVSKSVARWRPPDAALLQTPEVTEFDAATSEEPLRVEVSGVADWDSVTADRGARPPVSAYLRRRPQRSWQWRWPLRIAVLASPVAAKLLDEGKPWGVLKELYSVAETDGSTECEMLFIPAERVEDSFPNAAVVVIVGAAPSQMTEAHLSRAMQLGHAAVVFCPDDSLTWVNRLVFELSHDSPIDLALTVANPKAMLAADPDFVARATVRQWGLTLAAELQSRGATDGATEVNKIVRGPYLHEIGEANQSVQAANFFRQRGIVAALRAEPPRTAAKPPGPGSATEHLQARPDPTRVSPPPGDVEQRTVNAALFCAGEQRNSFVAGAVNLIRCWIGLPDKEAATADKTIPPTDIPTGGLDLLVQLYWRDGSGQEHTDSQSMRLPAGRTARSNDCELQISVPEGERYVTADILFLYHDKVFEAVRLGAFALAAGEPEEPQHTVQLRVQASRREVIELSDSQRVDATYVFGEDRPPTHGAAAPMSSTLRVFGDKRPRGFDLSNARVAIKWLNDTLFATEKLVVRRHEAAAPVLHAAETLDADDPDVRRLLRDMARHGAGLYNQLLNQGFVDPGARVAVLNYDPDTYVPLEFVYDRGYPIEHATLCPSGVAALTSGADSCPNCKMPVPDDERSNAPVICPFGFWSLRKVIERIAVGTAAQPSPRGRERRNLPVIDSVAFASSHLVSEAERMATQQALQQNFGRVTIADDWQQWMQAVAAHPSLLILLPHHGIQAGLDYLEIGEELLPETRGKLSRAQIVRQYVNADGRDPGPLVLLLGCQTAASTATGYVQLTQLIQQQRASIVLGTLSEILGRHAAPLARELATELVAVEDAEADFGTIMLRVRRRMLARGHLMALCLVALGDAEWRLTPRPRAVNT